MKSGLPFGCISIRGGFGASSLRCITICVVPRAAMQLDREWLCQTLLAMYGGRRDVVLSVDRSNKRLCASSSVVRSFGQSIFESMRRSVLIRAQGATTHGFEVAQSQGIPGTWLIVHALSMKENVGNESQNSRDGPIGISECIRPQPRLRP